MDKERIIRRVNRLRDKARQNSDKYDGKEQEYTFWGGFNCAYVLGQLSIMEELLDELDNPL